MLGAGVHGQLDLADVLAVAAGLDDRAGLACAGPGTGASQAYSLWVWPVKIASTSAEVSLTILANGPPAATSCSRVAPSGVPEPAPSWYFDDDHVGLALSGRRSCAATRLTASTGSPKSRSAMPAGADQGRGLLGDGADDGDLDAVDVQRPCTPAGPARWCPSCRRSRRGTANFALVPPAMTRSRRSAQPSSNSWLPTADAFSSSALSTSIVGWSFGDGRGEQRGADVVAGGQEAPSRSGAAAWRAAARWFPRTARCWRRCGRGSR